jgi:hypothetical protein
MTSCVSEPISFLKLERHRLGELPLRDARVVEEHLEQCAGCRACFESIERDSAQLALPPLPPPTRVHALPARKPSWLRRSVAAAGALALAAAMFLIVKPSDQALRTPPARVRVKGGDLAIELVRRSARGQLADSARFAEGDAFKVLLTCPHIEAPRRLEVVVYQESEAFFPLDTIELEACGNRRNLDGAFGLSGGQARVCVAIADELSRAALARGPAELPEWSVCARVVPAE